MSPAPLLLQQLLAWLCVLRYGSITVRKGQPQARFNHRHLPYLRGVFGLAAPPDNLSPTRDAVAQAKPQPLLLLQLHYLSTLAGLSHGVQGQLWPSPAAFSWVNSPTAPQAQLLLAPLIANTDHAAQLWRAYRLPGAKSIVDGFSFGELWTALSNAGSRGLAPHALAKHIPIKLIRNDDQQQPKLLAQAWLDLLLQLQAVTISPAGRYCILRQAAPQPTPPHEVGQWQAKWSPPSADAHGVLILMAPAMLPQALYQPASCFDLSDIAPLISTTPRWMWRLDRDAAQRSFQRGLKARHLILMLEQRLGKPLPAGLPKTLYRWAAQASAWVLQTGTLLQTDDASQLTQVLTQPGIRRCIERTLSPRAVLIKADKQAALLRQLKLLGLIPWVSPDIANNPMMVSDGFEQSSLAHAYVAARLGYALPELSNLGYRCPWGVIEDLARHLNKHDLAIAEQLIQQVLASNPHPQPSLTMTAPDAESDPVLAPEQTQQSASYLAQIEQAIAKAEALQIRYYSASDDRISERVIEPTRLDKRGTVLYVVAYCQQAKAERVFRLDRIRALNKPPDAHLGQANALNAN